MNASHTIKPPAKQSVKDDAEDWSVWEQAKGRSKPCNLSLTMLNGEYGDLTIWKPFPIFLFQHFTIRLREQLDHAGVSRQTRRPGSNFMT
jgi:hypothetical protein